MTRLQQAAFDRIATLNKDCLKLLPSRWNPNRDVIEIPVDDLMKVRDSLYEQEDLIEALWDEERKDGCEETI